jgi:hypothetical protein
MTRARAPLSALMMGHSMQSVRRQFFALGSDCALHLQAEGARHGEEAAVAAIEEIARIEVN